MNKLSIPMSEVSDHETFAFEQHLTEEAVRPKGTPSSGIREVAVAGTVSALDDEVLFRGTIGGVFERPCDRCLEPAEVSIELEAVWYFEPGIDPGASEDLAEYSEEDAFEEDIEGRRVRFFEGDEIDLAPHVWEELVLATPTKFHCTEECKGLCPQCGANLNAGTCSCAPEEATSNSGLAALKDMFPEAHAKSSEE